MRYGSDKTVKRITMSKLPTIDIKGKQYVLVKDRILAFHELYPQGSITTEKSENGDTVSFKAIVTPDTANPVRTFTGHSESVRGGTGVDFSSACENCETSAVGRALAILGIGIVDSVASGDEIKNAENNTFNRKFSNNMEGKEPTPNQKAWLENRGVYTVGMDRKQASDKISELKSRENFEGEQVIQND